MFKKRQTIRCISDSAEFQGGKTGSVHDLVVGNTYVVGHLSDDSKDASVFVNGVSGSFYASLFEFVSEAPERTEEEIKAEKLGMTVDDLRAQNHPREVLKEEKAKKEAEDKKPDGEKATFSGTDTEKPANTEGTGE